jgi:hypothetical protein
VSAIARENPTDPSIARASSSFTAAWFLLRLTIYICFCFLSDVAGGGWSLAVGGEFAAGRRRRDGFLRDERPQE